jgi:hypothetical protein
MTKVKSGTPNGQRNREILKSITENSFPVPTRRQATNFRRKTPDEVYADFPTRRQIHA